MTNPTEKFSGIVEHFGECDMPWQVVLVPESISQEYKIMANCFGYIAATFTVGKSSWLSSLLPYGGGKHFVALPAKVRKANNIKLGDKVSVEFELRERS